MKTTPPWFGGRHDLDGYTEQWVGVWVIVAAALAVAFGLFASNGVLLALGLLAALGGVFVVIYGRRQLAESWARQEASAARTLRLRYVEKQGTPAVARLLRATTVGEYGAQLVVICEIRVEKAGAESRAVSVWARFDPIEVSQLTPGTEHQVRLDPESADIVVLPGRIYDH